jgi:uncharacterized membrane protein YdbT with pleckstrin-like domain
MSYPTKLLNDHETIALDINPHWWFFAKAGAAAVVTAVLAAVAVVADWPGWLRTFFLILMVLSVIWLVVRYFKWTTTNFVVTSDRVIFREGVIAKHGVEIPLDRVNNVNFHQRLFERMIGTGDLLIESASEDGQSRFTDIRRPDAVQNLIHKQIYNSKHQRGPAYDTAMTSPPPPDVATQLEKLEGMLLRGSLSQAEFDAQKRRLLGTSDYDDGTPHAGSPLPPPPPGAGR